MDQVLDNYCLAILVSLFMIFKQYIMQIQIYSP
jgi:hypothetical protein